MSNETNLAELYSELSTPPAGAEASWFRQRGFRFERLLNRLLTTEGLEPRTGYRPAGEQIDGSFFLDGAVMLMEAKWHVDPLPASTLYQFKGKVDGKLVGTLGVFISMSGYSEDAVDALTLGKSLNVVLFDKKDMDAVFSRGQGFREILKRKLRKAAEEGVVYFPVEMEFVTRDRSVAVDIEPLRGGEVGNATSAAAMQASANDLIIICEGETDRATIAVLAERILSASGSNRTVKIVVAMGKVAIPRLANSLRSANQAAAILIVADGDKDVAATTELLNMGLQFEDWVAAVPDPSIENWLGLDPDRMRRRPGNARLEEYRTAAANVDLRKLAASDPSFAQFHTAVAG